MSEPAGNSDLHGSAPDTAPTVLILLDVLSDFAFPGGDQLLRQAMPIAESIRDLRARCTAAGIPAIYVNDNFGRWQTDFQKIIDHCCAATSEGRHFTEILRPRERDYFVLKPKHSGFFGTTLDLLLRYLQAKTLIITGLTGNICVLFTAQDAYLRDYELYIPADCVASLSDEENRAALNHLRTVVKADISESQTLDLEKLKRRHV